MSRGVPIISVVRLLTWLDARNASTIHIISWSGGVLTFGIAVGVGAVGLEAMVPTHGGTGTLGTLTLGGATVPYTTQTVKGVDYAVFAAQSGTYRATYATATPGIAGRPSEPLQR